MAFSNLVLPVPSEGFGLQAQNALSDAQIRAANAAYAPQQAQANAFLTAQQARFLPYQQSMSILSNPLVWASAEQNPALKAQLTNMMQNIPMGAMSSQGLPNTAPQGALPKLINAFMDKIGIGSNDNSMHNMPVGSSQMQGGQPPMMGAAQPGNALNMSPGAPGTGQGNAQGSPLVPATRGGINAGVIGSMVAPYMQSAYKQGATIADPDHPGEVISVPTSRMATQLQTQISAANRTIPQLTALPDLWGPFLTLKGHANLVGAKVGNYLQDTVDPKTLNSFGLTQSELPSQYADAKLAALTSVESYLKSIGVPVTVDVQAKLNDMIEPQFGENKKGYSGRIENETQRIIKDFVSQTLSQIKGGYSSAPEANPTMQSINQSQQQNSPVSTSQAKQAIKQEADNFKNQTIRMKSKEGKLYNVPQGKAQKFLDNGFERA